MNAAVVAHPGPIQVVPPDGLRVAVHLVAAALLALAFVVLIGGLALIGVFVFVESRVAAPMLPLRIFKVPTMAASLCASLFQAWPASRCCSLS